MDSKKEPPKEKSYGLSNDLKIVNFADLSSLRTLYMILSIGLQE